MNEKDTIDAIADALRSDPDFATAFAQSRASGDDASFDAAIAAALGVVPTSSAQKPPVDQGASVVPPATGQQSAAPVANAPSNVVRPPLSAIHRPASMQTPAALVQRSYIERATPQQPNQQSPSAAAIDPLAQFRPQPTHVVPASSTAPAGLSGSNSALPDTAEADKAALKPTAVAPAGPLASFQSRTPAIAPDHPAMKSMTNTAPTTTTSAEQVTAAASVAPANSVPATPVAPAPATQMPDLATPASQEAAPKPAAPKPVSATAAGAKNSVDSSLEKAEITWKEAEAEAAKATAAKAAASKAGTPAAKDAAAVALRKADIAWKAAVVETQLIASAKSAGNAPKTWSKDIEANVETARKRAEAALTAAGVDINPAVVAKTGAAKASVAPTKPAKVDAAAKPKRHRKKLTAFKLSFLLAVLVPTLLVGVYYLFIASDQYRSEMRFAVRGTERSPLENLGLSVLPGASSSASDAYIVIDYMHSKQVLVDIQQKLGIDVRSYFSKPDVDFAYRIDPKISLDEFIEYWRWMIDASFNSTTSITTFEITAFSAEDSRAIASAVLKVSDELVNELSAKARLQLISTAQNEVARTEKRLAGARQAIADFQSTELTSDPVLVATSNQELVSGMEKQIIELRAKRTFLLATVDETAPSIRVLDRQIASMSAQLKAKRQEIGVSTSLPGEAKPLSRQLSEFNALMVEKEFAEKAYTTALASLETSQAEARRQERYFAIVVEPSVPEVSLYPDGIANTFVAFVSFFVMWLLGYLVIQSIRDHSV